MNRAGFAIAGAAAGALIRWAVGAWWPSSIIEYLATLALAGLAGVLLGWWQQNDSGPAVFGLAAAGTAASLGVAAAFGVGQLPQWFALFVLAFPLCAATGFAAGLLAAGRRGDPR